MIDEERLSERTQGAAGKITVPDRAVDDAVARGRSWRRRRRLTQASVAGLLTVTLGAAMWAPLPLAGSDTSLRPGGGTWIAPSSPSPTASTDSSGLPGSRAGWMAYVDDQGVTVEIPETWTFRSTLQVGLLSPEPVFAIGTWSFPAGGSCAPTAALDSLASDGALAWMVEYDSPEVVDDFPPRPDHLSLGPLGGPTECAGRKTHMVLFRDRGRYFQIFVVLGQDVTEASRSDLLSALNSIGIEPAAQA